MVGYKGKSSNLHGGKIAASQIPSRISLIYHNKTVKTNSERHLISFVLIASLIS